MVGIGIRIISNCHIGIDVAIGDTSGSIPHWDRSNMQSFTTAIVTMSDDVATPSVGVATPSAVIAAPMVAVIGASSVSGCLMSVS